MLNIGIIRILITGFLAILLCRFLVAQEPVKMRVPEKDSIHSETPVFYQPGLDLPDFETSVPGFMEYQTKLDWPVFDFSRYMNTGWSVDYSSPSFDYLNTWNNRTLFFRHFLSPFGGEGTFFNQATYRVSDKLLIGGNSFGVNSFLRGPLPKFGSNSFDIRGASLFMEYKVSKNFRIGGGITITDHPMKP